MEVWTLWHATYRLSGAVKLVTAIASVTTAILLVRLVPQALALPSPETLRREVAERKLAEEALSEANRRLIEAHEEERARIARELHDDINQRLTFNPKASRKSCRRRYPYVSSASCKKLSRTRRSIAVHGTLRYHS